MLARQIWFDIIMIGAMCGVGFCSVLFVVEMDSVRLDET